jgi:glutathione S-transferase/pterin-4a-carbinolamine dehydratase
MKVQCRSYLKTVKSGSTLQGVSHVKLLMIPSCPFVQRVLIAMQLRKITETQIETEVIDLSKPPAELLKVNPTGSVPTLLNKSGAGFHESHAIMQFLDSLEAPGSKLFGSNPFDAARIQALLELNATRILGPIQQALYTKGNMNLLRSAANQLHSCFNHLDEALKSSGGPFLGGQELNALDISLAPFIVRLPFLFEIYPQIGRPTQGSKTEAYIAALRSNKCIVSAMPPEHAVKKSVEDFSTPSALLSDCISAPRTLLKDQKNAISNAADSLSLWKVEHDGKGFCLKTKLEFKSHAEAVAMLNWLHDAQETTDHHTSFSMHDFQYAEITMVTHEPEWGISEKDLALAKAIQHQFSGKNKK